MSLVNKIFIGLIAVATIGFFYLSARTLKIQKHWAQNAQAFEKRIKEVRTENKALAEGSIDQTAQGIRQLRVELHRLLVHRGRVWRNCMPKVADPQTGKVTLVIEKPEPHGITDKLVLFAFEEGPQGVYIGQFKTVGVSETTKQIAIEPAMKLTLPELQRLNQSRKPWSLYDMMPGDNAEVFADLKPEELKTLFPESVVAEYLRDGKPAEAGDPEPRKFRGKYVRRLRDYRMLFEYFVRQRTVLADLRESSTRDKQYIDAALAQAKAEEEACRKDVADLKVELARFQKERDLVAGYLQRVQQGVASRTKAIEEFLADNRAKADELARIQRSAALRVNQRTNTMAHAGVVPVAN